jgi:hypothetical protein
VGLFGPNVEKLKAAGDVAGLIALLSAKQSVKVRAGQALIDLGDAAVAPLLEALSTVGEPAATALAGMGPSPQSFGGVCRVLRDGNQTGQFAAVHALTLWAMFGDEASFDQLVWASSDHSNIATKTCANFALQDVASPPVF